MNSLARLRSTTVLIGALLLILLGAAMYAWQLRIYLLAVIMAVSGIGGFLCAFAAIRRETRSLQTGKNPLAESLANSQASSAQQQRLAEQALQESQARFARAINGTQDGLFDFDIVGDTTWFSPRCRRMLGYGEHEMHFKVSDLLPQIHAGDVAAATQNFLDLAQNDVPYDAEFRVCKKNGDYLWVRARAVAEFNDEGRTIRLSGSIQDVSEARAVHAELRRATEISEAANRAKTAFLAIVSHEIRTPMNGVIGMTGLLLDTQLDRVQREFAEIIRNSADSLLHVINDILDFSKIEAGKLEIDAADMDLRATVEDVCAMMALQAAARQVELIIDLRSEVPEMVRADVQRIRQCLLNLLSNAVKFTSSGEIVVEVCVIAQKAGQTLVQFLVRDTGIGIESQQLGALFQPFVQADSSTTRQFGGTGLGLSIVKRLVELMGGQVGVESEAGKGATFWFVLPLEPLDPSGNFARLSSNAFNKRLLVVDDNETHRKVLGNLLARFGFSVDLAADGPDALQQLKDADAENKPFDAALLDFQMPLMDGATLGEIINNDAQLAKTRLLLLTSLDRADDQQRFAAIGFAGYLTKPVRARELKECLDQVLAIESREWHLRSQPIVTRNVLANSLGAPRHGGYILLVEDNLVNQQVAQKYLERLGCQVHTVGDGLAGVNAYKEARFDLILMDMQMPVMDGIAATREIRALEHGNRHIPIVALTADVMAGQLERCLEAGMDDFLTKPLDANRLRDVLDRFGLTAHVPFAATQQAASAPAMESTANTVDLPLDLARLNDVAAGDKEFLRELLATFLDSTRACMDELQASMDGMQHTAIARVAHKLKGSSASVKAMRLQLLSEHVEAAAAQHNNEQLKKALGKLELEVRRVQSFVEQLHT